MVLCRHLFNLLLLLVQFVLLVSGLSTTTTPEPSTGHRALTRVKLSNLVTNVKDTRSLFRAGLRRDHVVLVSLDDVTDQAVISHLWNATSEFFALTDAEQALFGPLFEAPTSEHHRGHSRLVGYTADEHNNRFLDLRLRRRRRKHPVGADETCAGCTTGEPADPSLELLPRGLDIATGTTTLDIARALAQGSQVLFDVGMAALTAAMADRDDVGDIRTMVDLKENLMEGATSATVLRLVSYGAAVLTASNKVKDESSSPAAGGKGASPKNNVAFASHTDGTWFTVVPCAVVPGLEVMSGDGCWLKPEEQGRPGIDVAVLTGDFLQSLSAWEFASATHRVVRPPNSSPPRLSAPLLMRPSPAYRAGRLSDWQAERALEESAAASQFSAARLRQRSAQCAKDRAAEALAASNLES